MSVFTSRTRFLGALACEPVDRPPVWVMRQAGRYLPEYRALKEKHGFLGLVGTPELAAEVTLQPLKRFELDAAIIFSDILVIPEAMGQPYYFRDEGGIGMEFEIKTASDIRRLDPSGVAEKLSHIFEAIRLVRKELGDEKALLGFAGSPWTLACYMVEGGSSKRFSVIKSLFFQERDLFDELMNKLCTALSEYLELQSEAGVDAVQIFDSWAAQCPGNLYMEMSAQWISRVVSRLRGKVPVIAYAKGMAHFWEFFQRAGAAALGLDWTVDMARMRHEVSPRLALQGNLDPLIMSLGPDVVRQEAKRLLEGVQEHPGIIINLGHGIQPDAQIECMEALVDAAKAARGPLAQ